jgi:hypothetical protein
VQSKREQQDLGREKLQHIIESCKSIEDRSLDPFLIDIDQNIGTLKKYFPEWKIPEDLCLDAETIHQLASIIRLQNEWVKHRSTSLYTDPFLLEDKLRRTDKIGIIKAFLQAWRPMIELEQISLYSLAEALKYWESLLTLKERWKELPPTQVGLGVASREELVNQRILRDKAFTEELESFWHELKISVTERGAKSKIRYWAFIGAETYEETVFRAFMTSFLVTYGYATLELHPLEEEMFIVPFDEPEERTATKQLVSIPVAVSRDDWQQWRGGELE